MDKHVVPKLILGDVHISEGVLDVIPIEELTKYISKHEYGDWGDIPQSDKDINEVHLDSRKPILSMYNVKGNRVFVITDGSRASTWVILPQDLRKHHGLKGFRSNITRKAS